MRSADGPQSNVEENTFWYRGNERIYQLSPLERAKLLSSALWLWRGAARREKHNLYFSGHKKFTQNAKTREHLPFPLQRHLQPPSLNPLRNPSLARARRYRKIFADQTRQPLRDARDRSVFQPSERKRNRGKKSIQQCLAGTCLEDRTLESVSERTNSVFISRGNQLAPNVSAVSHHMTTRRPKMLNHAVVARKYERINDSVTL